MGDISQHFGTIFPARVWADYQKTTSVLRSLLHNEPCTGAGTVKFKRTSSLTSGSKSRNGYVPVSFTNDTTVSVDAADRFAATIVDDLDVIKQNANRQGTLSMLLNAAIERWIDDTIGTAFDAATTRLNWSVGPGTVDGPLTYGLFKSIRRTFANANVPNAPGMEGGPGDMSIAIGPDQYEQFLDFIGPNGVSLLTISNEFTNDKRLDADPSKAFRWGGYNWVVMTGLPTGTDANNVEYTKCFAWHRMAAGLALQQMPSTEVGRLINRDGDMIKVKAAMGAGIINDTGILEFDCQNG